ncbi:hypothetical protein Hamer_G016613 [Homarus americanus]|uniref:RNA-directed DNA polymerase n=1 Tax=Homarus americanus TaxID=6706 RepID=A0A8J5JU28_HOMAM|nr:hypothetical protein Hamer_G016613 [Homarus americanus]
MNSKWTWTEKEERCFNKLKEAVMKSEALMHFNPQLPTTLIYDFTVQPIKGSANPADILSRQPLPFDAQISEEEKLAEGFINNVVANGIPKAMTLSEILEESGKDPTIRALKDAIAKNDWTDKLTEPFKHVRAELTSKRGLVLRGSRIVMSQTLQRRTMQLAHKTHLGMIKTKALLRGKVWWPTINKDVEKAIRQCIPCASLDTRKQANPVNMSEMKGPWEVIHVDICGPFPSGTPHTGETPAKLLMGRNIKVKLPQVSYDLEDTQVTCWDVARKRDKREKEKLKLRTDNRNKSKPAELRPTDQVLLKQTKKDKLSTNYDSKPWTVSERRGDSAILQRGPKKILRSTAQTGMDKSRQDGNSEEEPLAARQPRRTIVKPKKYQDGAEDFGTDGSESSGTDEVDDSEMHGETSDQYKPGRSWN